MNDAHTMDAGGSAGTQLLDELLRALGFHFWLILLVAIGSVLATYAGLQVVSEQYVSTGQLLVKLGRENVELPVTVDKGGLLSTGVRREEINSEIQLISARQLIEATVDTIGLDAFNLQPPEPTTWFGRAKRTLRDAVKAVRANISELAIFLNLRPRLTEREKVLLLVQTGLTVEREKDSDVIAITVRLPSAALASQVVDTLIALYLDRRLAIRRDHGMSEFFDEQLVSLRDKLKSLDTGKLRLRERSNISTVDAERTLLIGRLQTLLAEIAIYERELNLLGSGASAGAGTSKRPRPAGTLVDTPSDPSLRLSSYPNLEQMRSKITELRLRKTELLQKFLPDAEAVLRIDREIERIDATMRHAFASMLNERMSLATSIERRLSALNKGEMELEGVLTGGVAGLDPGDPLGVGFDQPRLHVVDRLHRAAHRVDLGELGAGAGLERLDLALDRRVAVEDVVEFQQVGLEGEDLLHPAATIADPRAAAGPAPRSRPAAAPRGPGPFSTA